MLATGPNLASSPLRVPAAAAWHRWVVGLAAAVVAVLGWRAVCTVPGVPWNPARLAPSFALAQGLPIYALRDSGQQLGWFYGPGFPVWYLPCALTDNPTAAHLLAAGWNAVTLLAPLLLVLRLAGARGARLATLAVLAALLRFGHGTMHWDFSFLHVDGVCLALVLLGAAAAHRAAARDDARWLHLAALALALACWTKQTAVMAYPAVLVWLWREGRTRLAGRAAVWCAAYGAAVTAAVFAGFGAEPVLFNVSLVHLRNPWIGGWALAGRNLGELLLASLGWVPLLAWAAWRGRSAPARPLPVAAGSLLRLLLWLAAWSAPVGLLATLKAGGGLNSVHALPYLLAALLVWVAVRLEDPPPDGPGRKAERALWLAALLVPAVSGVVLAERAQAAWWPDRGQEALLAQARAQPGRYYFPWNPLVTLIADHRVQPLDDALYCLWNARLEVPAELVRAAVPAHPIIVYVEPAQSHFALRYFRPPEPGR
jgi:hypothetical protein